MLRFLYFFSAFLLLSIKVWAFSMADLGFKVKNREHIQIVGSSTVYPFAAVIAETFGRDTEFRTPIVEATGTGGGFKLFCMGVGYDYPDFIDASRTVKASEIKKCSENGVKQIGEIKIGYDGIVLANSKSGKKYNLTKKQIFLALAAKIPASDSKNLIDNPNEKWSDIDPKLPSIKIAIYGPPTTSGTRDAFVELVMEGACVKEKAFILAYPNKKIRKKKCHIIRSDGKFIEAGENDNLIVQKLKNDKNALGIFGFNFLEENHNIIQPATINGVEPSFKNIVTGNYAVSRPLFIYFKRQHLDFIPGMRQFILEITNKNTIGSDGYLLQKGLIPLSDSELKIIQKSVSNKIK